MSELLPRHPGHPAVISSSSYPGPADDAAPNSPTFPESKPKKSNPLNDLIETERLFVEQLTAIIRRIAAAWSRSNLPPPELDTMFRSIEAVYKANKSLYSKLKDIGINPSSPKALGDLLMKWITDLEIPYTNYCTKYCCGFDDWEPVKSNQKLPEILKIFTASFPLPSEESPWTLDALFLLPKGRLKYYRKLYNRLLKGTVAGRSDHRLLVAALDKLDVLLATLESRQSIKVGGLNPPASPKPETEDEVVIDLRTQSILNAIENSHELAPNTVAHRDDGSPGNSIRGSPPDGVLPPSNLELTPAPKMTIKELEMRLSTERTLDIFTMSPKAVRLQISPQNLTFTREIRFSLDVLIHFTSKATNTEVIHRKGYIVILSDLFLICDRITPEEKAQREVGAADMWLSYPPLAGKVLRIAQVEGQPHALQVAVMKKEFLIVETDSANTRDTLMSYLRECIDFSVSLPPPSKEPPPPVPPLKVSFNKDPIRSDSDKPQNISLNHGTPPTNDREAPRYPYRQDSLPRHLHDTTTKLGNSVSNLTLGPEVQLQRGAQRTPAIHNSTSGPSYVMGPAVQSQEHHPRPNAGNGVPPHAQSFANSRSMPLLGGPPTSFSQPNPVRPQEPPAFLRQAHLPPQQQAPLMSMQPGMYGRPPSESGTPQAAVRKSSSMRSLASQYSQQERFSSQPPLPGYPDEYSRNGQPIPRNGQPMPRTGSMGNLRAASNRPLLPSAQLRSRGSSIAEPSFDDPSPPGSPIEEFKQDLGPVTSSVSAQMKCKVFLQQHHAQWKSLGSAKLILYCQNPTNIKQLVVQSNKSVLISTIVLTDGVERVGKTGVAVELSDKGARTGIIYMLQLQNETTAARLFDSLLAGSDRSK